MRAKFIRNNDGDGVLPGTERAVPKGDREAGCAGAINVWERVTDIGPRVALGHVKGIVTIDENFHFLDAFLRECPTTDHANTAMDTVIERLI